jgi:hypothetical protein
MSEPRRAVKRTISMPLDFLEAGVKRSKEQNRTFSSYVANLVAQDIKRSLLSVSAAETEDAKGEAA